MKEDGRQLPPEVCLTKMSQLEQIQLLLFSENPPFTLAGICEAIPQAYLSHCQSTEWWHKNDRVNLLFHCLPLLHRFLKRHSRGGMSGRELFEEGFHSLQNHVFKWSPELKLRDGRPNYLSCYVSNKVDQDLQRFIDRQQKIRSRKADFKEGVVPLFEFEEKSLLEVSTDNIRKTLLTVLSEREKLVLELRYGLLDGRIWTQEETGEKMNVTGSRIRQIEARALRKLRNLQKKGVIED